MLTEYPPTGARRTRSLFDQAQRVGGRDADGWVLLPDRKRCVNALTRTADALIDDLDGALSDFLSEAQGRSFCDGCLAIELHVSRLDVQSALGSRAAPMDRGHGRCSGCGQTLPVTRVATE